MRSRSSRGSTSSRYSPVNDASVQVARSEPEPLTHRIRAGRTRKSTSSALAEVLPPPQLAIERSAPNLRERATSCARVVNVEICVIALILPLSPWIPTTRETGNSLPCHTLSISTDTESCYGIGIATLAGTSFSQQWANIRLISLLEQAIRPQHITGFLGFAQGRTVHQ